MKEKTEEISDRTAWYILSGFISIAFVVIVGIAYIGYDMGYKQGQIDAQNGLVRYCLVKLVDNSMEWRWCEDSIEVKHE